MGAAAVAPGGLETKQDATDSEEDEVLKSLFEGLSDIDDSEEGDY